MKKTIALLMVAVLMLVPLLAGCEPSMQEKYADVFAKLDGNTWFYEGDASNSVNKISFTLETATMGSMYNDGNGCHTSTDSSTCTYIIDDINITVSLSDGTTHVIPYTLTDGELDLEGYFTPDEIAEGLEGYWKSRKSSYVLGKIINSEDNVQISGNKIINESATEASAYNDVSYYYYGPYEGTFAVTAEGIDTDIKHASQYGFVIEDGTVKLMIYTNVCSRTTSFPGEDGYVF